MYAARANKLELARGENIKIQCNNVQKERVLTNFNDKLPHSTPAI